MRLTPPTLYINENWIANNGRYSLTTSPSMLCPVQHQYNQKFENLNNILIGGIYNKKLIDQYTKYLSNSQLKIRASDAIAQRMINYRNNNDFNILDLMTEKDIHQLKTTILSGLTKTSLNLVHMQEVLLVQFS